MIKLSNKYRQQISLDRDEILNLLQKSNDFVKEISSGYGGQIYTSSLTNKIFYKEIPSNKIQLSENAGLGGPFEMIGELYFDTINRNSSEIVIDFQIGVFPMKTPYLLIVIFGLAGLLILFLDFYLSLLPFGLMMFSLLMLFKVQYTVRFILKRLEKALNISDNWKTNVF